MISFLFHIFLAVVGLCVTWTVSISMIKHDPDDRSIWQLILIIICVSLYFYVVGLGILTLLQAIGGEHAISAIIQNIPKLH